VTKIAVSERERLLTVLIAGQNDDLARLGGFMRGTVWDRTVDDRLGRGRYRQMDSMVAPSVVTRKPLLPTRPEKTIQNMDLRKCVCIGKQTEAKATMID
jgi:hypothetical protein